MPVLLLRHCETTGQEIDRPLSDDGQAQAVALSSMLRSLDIVRLISSPAKRALDTILPYAMASRTEIEIDERLRERQLAQDLIDVYEYWIAAVERAFAEPELRLPGGETGQEVRERMLAALHWALDEEDEGVVVLVTHGQALSTLLSALDGGDGFERWSGLTNPDAYLVERLEDGRLDFRRLPELLPA